MNNTQNWSEVSKIEVDSIKICDRKRDLVESKVEVLMRSIQEIGMMQPIVLNKDHTLLAGRHRLEACIRLGMSEVNALVKDLDSVDAELAEIDENLIRFELTDLERSVQYARRKVLYETKNKDIKSKSFVDDTAEKTGRSKKTVRDETKLGEVLLETLSEEVRDLISPTKVAKNKTDLQRLVAEPDPEVRLAAAKTISDSFSSGENISVSEAYVKMGMTPEGKSVKDGEKTLLSALSRTERLLNGSVNSRMFRPTVEEWTTDALYDIREEFFRIRSLADKGIAVLSDIIEER